MPSDIKNNCFLQYQSEAPFQVIYEPISTHPDQIEKHSIKQDNNSVIHLVTPSSEAVMRWAYKKYKDLWYVDPPLMAKQVPTWDYHSKPTLGCRSKTASDKDLHFLCYEPTEVQSQRNFTTVYEARVAFYR